MSNRRTMIHDGKIHYASETASIEWPSEMRSRMPIPAFQITLCNEHSYRWGAVLPENDPREITCEKCLYFAKSEDNRRERFPDHGPLEHFALTGNVWHSIYVGEDKTLESLCGEHPQKNRFHLVHRFDHEGRLVYTDCYFNEMPKPVICSVCSKILANKKKNVA